MVVPLAQPLQIPLSAPAKTKGAWDATAYRDTSWRAWVLSYCPMVSLFALKLAIFRSTHKNLLFRFKHYISLCSRWILRASCKPSLFYTSDRRKREDMKHSHQRAVHTNAKWANMSVKLTPLWVGFVSVWLGCGGLSVAKKTERHPDPHSQTVCRSDIIIS